MRKLDPTWMFPPRKPGPCIALSGRCMMVIAPLAGFLAVLTILSVLTILALLLLSIMFAPSAGSQSVKTKHRLCWMHFGRISANPSKSL